MSGFVGIDPNEVEQAGWGVVFTHDADPRVRDALKELLEFRKAQANRDDGRRLYRECVGDSAYRAGDPAESARTFLARNGASPGEPAIRHTVPFYLLLVGDPVKIPYSFQIGLDSDCAVGRVWFETEDGVPDLEAFARYARSVVESESAPQPRRPQVAFVAVRNPDDKVTQLLADNLVQPLAAVVSRDCPGWTVGSFLGQSAQRGRIADLLQSEDRPSFVFMASHGVVFPHGHALQSRHQGALVCQDWPGPRTWRQAIRPDFYFSVDDLDPSVQLKGLIAFFYSAYSAGTPEPADLPHRNRLSSNPKLAPRPFVGRLPQRMLSHPNGGALAVIGLVDQAWGCSFLLGGRTGRLLQTFESTVTGLLQNRRVGWALKSSKQAYATLSADLDREIASVRLGKTPDQMLLSHLWAARNDARNLVVVGDPAVRLPGSPHSGR